MANQYVVFPHHDRGNTAAPVTTSRPAGIAASTL
jgi:hypothetical protein